MTYSGINLRKRAGGKLWKPIKGDEKKAGTK